MKIRYLLFLLLLIATFGLGVFLTWQFAKPTEREVINESTILLERVRKVCKLVTVEGDLQETYKGGDIWNLALYVPFPTTIPFEKQAIIHVKGTVLVGFDMNDMTIEMDQKDRHIIISQLPPPSILAIDHELSYYNIEESWFNSFSAKDYTKLNQEAKQKLADAAEVSQLMEDAKTQGNELLEVITFIAESAGWTLIYKNGNPISTETEVLAN